MALSTLYTKEEKRVLLPVLADEPTKGVRNKPPGCSDCAYRRIGQGFVPHFVPENPVIAMLLEAPGGEEVLEGRPLVGKAGKFWLRSLIESNGFSREDILIANTLSCRPPNNSYPVGKMRKAAETSCRQYDGPLLSWDPNVIIITMHPAMLLRSSAMLRLVKADVKKAFDFAAKGFRPLVLMGDKAMGIFAPWAQGGVKRWRGHYWEGSLKKEISFEKFN